MNVRSRIIVAAFSVALAVGTTSAQQVGPDPSPGNAPAWASGAPSIERQSLGTSSVELKAGSNEGRIESSLDRPSREPNDAGKSSSLSGYGQPAVAVAAVSGLIVALGFAVRLVMRNKGGLLASLGAGGRAPSGLIEILARYPVGRQSTLIVLKIDRRVLLINQSGAQRSAMTVLTEFTDPAEVASILLRTRDEAETRSAARFQSVLSGAGEAYEEPPPKSFAPSTFGSLRKHLKGLLQPEVMGKAS